MHLANVPRYTRYAGNGGNPGNSMGTALTNVLGASNADGTAATLIGTPLGFEGQLLAVTIDTNNSNGANTASLLDILLDPAGGTSWDTANRFITSLPVGFAETAASGNRAGRSWVFPVRVPRGATIGAVGRNTTGSARTCTVHIQVLGGADPANVWVGQKVDAFGDDRANSRGTAVAPSASANTFGSWVSIGSTLAADYAYWQMSTQGPYSSSFSATHYRAELGAAHPGQSEIVVPPPLGFSTSTTTITTGPKSAMRLGHRPVEAAAQMKIRVMSGSASGASPDFILHGVR